MNNVNFGGHQPYISGTAEYRVSRYPCAIADRLLSEFLLLYFFLQPVLLSRHAFAPSILLLFTKSANALKREEEEEDDDDDDDDDYAGGYLPVTSNADIS